MKIQTCRCGTQFVQRPHHETGKLNPITTQSYADGNIAVLRDGRYRVIRTDEEYIGIRFKSHFSDCPYSKSFKRGSS